MRVRARQGDYWLPFLPDGYFEIAYRNGDVQACLVEIDVGTLTLRRFARKIQSFETALDDEVFRSLKAHLAEPSCLATANRPVSETRSP
jgi:hypothetical protein